MEKELIKKLYFLCFAFIFGCISTETQDTFHTVQRANRRVNAKIVRTAAATQDAAQLLKIQLSNGDTQRFFDKRGNFFKLLAIQDNGLVDLVAFDQMIRALDTTDPNDFNKISMGTSPVERKLVNPQAAFAFNLDGADGWIHTTPPAPSVSSAETAGEMVELYWHALLRDVPFNEYGMNPIAAQAVTDLNNLSTFKGPKVGGVVTTGTLFKGDTSGDLIGPFISQFLYLPVPYGPAANFNNGVSGTPGIDFQAQKVPTSGTINDFMTAFNEWLFIQRGNNPTKTITFTGDRQFIKNMRNMGDYVHQDFPEQAYNNAARILINFGDSALDQSNPYLGNPTQEAFVTYGLVDIFYLISVAVEVGLRTAWYQKWRVHLRLRPEYYAFLVNQQILGIQNFGLSSDVINSAATTMIFAMNGTYFLPMAYPEGSPGHPSYPAGHAVLSGAAATILKAFFNESFIIPNPLQPNGANTALEASGGVLTVGDELNKLASNISLGRDYAGVHYRSDGIEGILLGEKVAIALLNDEAFTRNIPFFGFSLTKFDGTKITVGAKKQVQKLG